MKRIVLVFALLLLGLRAVSASAQDTSAAGEIQTVINNQMAAFAADDFVQAFDFAADNIQRMFVTPENFGVMVQRGYPMVHRARDVRFGALSVEGDVLRQRVLVRDSAGALHTLDYLMIRAGDTWRIAGVFLVRPNDVGA